MKGMAFNNPLCCQPEAFYGSILFKRFHSIVRTARIKPTAGRKKGGNTVLVASNGQNKGGRKKLFNLNRVVISFHGDSTVSASIPVFEAENQEDILVFVGLLYPKKVRYPDGIERILE